MMIQSKKNPKVSVCVITYNQQNYIRQCLQSIVDQVTDFDFEVIVGEDCSTDETRAIVQEFAERYPDIVKPIYQEKNIGGGVYNFLAVHRAAVGEYVAHVDGDDYCLPGKLQAQADYLDKNPECKILWHRMYTLSGDGNLFEDNFAEIGMTNNLFHLEDIICNITVGLHSSKMYRCNRPDDHQPSEKDAIDFAINVLQLNCSSCSYAAFVSDVPYGVYRANIGLSKHTAKVRKMVYSCLWDFYSAGIADKSVINAKIAWMLISDIRHLQGSFFYGLSLFLTTIMNLNFRKLRWVRSRRYPTLLRFRQICAIGDR